MVERILQSVKDGCACHISLEAEVDFVEHGAEHSS